MPRSVLITLCILLAAHSPLTRAAVTLVEPGDKSDWRYLDNDQRPPAAWFQSGFDDGAWLAGRAPLGFGEPDLTTVVRWGPNPSTKAPTTYFRHSFDVEAPERWRKLLLFLRVDDGARIFLNGQDVARIHLPAGPIAHTTLATVAVSLDDEHTYHVLPLPASALVAGRNVLAVEVHQCNAVSTDLILDAKLRAYAADEDQSADDSPVSFGGPTDPVVAGLASVRAGDFPRARALLERVPETHPRFQSVMLQAGEAFGVAARPELGLPLVERAYRRAPDDQRTAYAWARAQLLARTNLVAPPAPRTRPSKILDTWRWIVTGPAFPDRSKKFPRVLLEADLDYLEAMIANGFSYADRTGADWRAALDAVRASLAPETGLTTFTFRLNRFFAIFGDGHSGLRTPGIPWPRGYLPFLPVPDASPHVLALKPDRSAFLDPAHPYVAALVGRPLDEWLRTAALNIPHGSPHHRWRSTVRDLADVNYLRGEMNLPATPELAITLRSADGTSTRELTIPISTRRPRLHRAPDTHFVRDGIGYLRVGLMLSDDKFLTGLDAAMRDLRSTRGLVLDIRNNGGGSQDALRTLLPYFLPPRGPLRVVNVARYRIPVKFGAAPREGFLPSDRFLHPVSASVWSEADRAELRAFLATFQPEWTPPTGTFSEWHLMALRHETNPAAYSYDRSVVVLCDSDAGSAADNFVGAFKGLPAVTVLGTTSLGTSGRMAHYTLPHTKLVATLSQMVSYRANGKLYEGAGVEPDIVALPKPTDYLTSAGDSILEAAFARLASPSRASSQQ